MKAQHPKTQRNGFVVVVVLCLITMMAALLLGFNTNTRTNLRNVDTLRKSAQALNCARAGLNIAIAAIRDNNSLRTNRRMQELLSGRAELDIVGGKCLLDLTEENGKLNVNTLKDKNNKLNRTRIDQLLRLIDLLNRRQSGDSHVGYGLAPALVDWVDGDDEITALPFIKREKLGAESRYYQKLPVPYRCKNAPLEAAEELLLIRGITPPVFELLQNYITVYGDGKVNINCAPMRVIQSLSADMDPVLAQVIIARRQFRPFESIAELRNVAGMTGDIYDNISGTVTISPAQRYYRIESRAEVDGIDSIIIAVLKINTEDKRVDVVLYREI